MPLADVDTEMLERWARAEDSLYGSLLSDPSTYERVIELVGALAAYLRKHATDVGLLVAEAGRGLDLVALVDPRAVIAPIPAVAALNAACAIRLRELRAAEKRQVRVAAVNDARAVGNPWAVLGGSGSGAAGGLATTLHIHVATGAAISSRAEMDIDTGGVVFVVSPACIDLSSGSMRDAPPSLGTDRPAGSAHERDRFVEELRACVERLASENHLV